MNALFGSDSSFCIPNGANFTSSLFRVKDLRECSPSKDKKAGYQTKVGEIITTYSLHRT